MNTFIYITVPKIYILWKLVLSLSKSMYIHTLLNYRISFIFISWDSMEMGGLSGTYYIAQMTINWEQSLLKPQKCSDHTKEIWNFQMEYSVMSHFLINIAIEVILIAHSAIMYSYYEHWVLKHQSFVAKWVHESVVT